MLTTKQEIEDAIYLGETAYVSSESEIRLDSPIRVTNPSTIVGGRFYAPSGLPAFEVVASGSRLERMDIRGSGTANTRVASEKLIYCFGTSTEPLENISIKNTNLHGSSSDNIWLQYVNQSKVLENDIQDYLYSGVMLISCDGVRVAVNDIRDAPLSNGVLNTYGIAATDTANTVAARSKNIIIADNILENMEWEGIDTHGGSHISVTGNILRNCVRGIALVVGNSTRLTAPNNCLVSGNILDGMGSLREGISLYGLSGNSADATITSNRIIGYKIPIGSDYYNRATTYIGGNNVPHIGWTSLPLANGWRANSMYPPQFMVDDDTVFLRGMVVPPAEGFNTVFANISSAYAPSVLSFVRQTKGSNAMAGEATIGVSPAGTMTMYYNTIKDLNSYPIESQYRMI